MDTTPSSCCQPQTPKKSCSCGEPSDCGVASLPPINRREDLLCRLSNRFRMKYSVPPGIYSIGNPAKDTPVLVTANYHLTCNSLQDAMKGRDAWVLVLDTKGINVWCAAGKGTFGTSELIKRISTTSIASYVNHRTLILPQLGAPGVAAHEVTKATGFSIVYGPVNVEDLPEFIDNAFTATEKMRTVTFTLPERAVLIPMELFPALRKLILIALGIMAVLGVQTDALYFKPALLNGLPLAALGIIAVIAGTVLFPLLLPLLPGRSFAFKGAFLGILVIFPFTIGFFGHFIDSILLATAACLFSVTTVSYCALNFTGCTPFTNISGVKHEMRIAVPVYLTACTVAAGLFFVFKLLEMRIV